MGVMSGKTLFGSFTAFKRMHERPNAMFWWCAGLDFQLRRWWEYFKPWAQALNWKVRDIPHPYAQAPNGSRMYGITTKSLNMLAAYHPNEIYIDEGSKITEQAWQLLRVRMIKADFVAAFSTPKPNYWRTLVNQAKDPLVKNWGYVHCTTAQAGIATPAQIAELKRTLPAELFAQELEAQMVSSAGTVFPGIRRLAVGDPEPPIKGVTYKVTYDPAKHVDFAWVTVWRGRKVVACAMWQKKRIQVSGHPCGFNM